MATVTRKIRGGKWYAIYTSADGKQKWKAGYTDKAETQRLADKLETEARKVRLGQVDPREESRRVEQARGIAAHVAQYKAALQAAGNSANHVSYTIADIEKFIVHSGATRAVNVTRPQVDAWVNSLKTAGDDSARTINRRVGSVQAFLRWLENQKSIPEYVLKGYPKLKTTGKEARKRRALSADEVTALLASAAAERIDLYRFALKTLARYSQIAALKVSDIDFKAGSLSFQTKDSAHRDRKHVVPLHPDLRTILEKRCEGKGREDLVWTDLPRREIAAKRVREDCEAAGVDTTHVDFHALRHTGITRLAELNVHPAKVQKLAGHASIETTLQFYTHLKEADEAAAIALL